VKTFESLVVKSYFRIANHKATRRIHKVAQRKNTFND